jgi:glycine cleavage system H protein
LPLPIAIPDITKEERMKEMNELNLPDNLRYSKAHEWVSGDGDLLKVGISDYAQDQLGDIVYVELPEVGVTLDQGEEFGTVESVKAVSELLMPISGEVVAVNMELEDSPELVTDDPYGGGWMIEVKPNAPGQWDALMDHKAYLAMLRG